MKLLQWGEAGGPYSPGNRLLGSEVEVAITFLNIQAEVSEQFLLPSGEGPPPDLSFPVFILPSAHHPSPQEFTELHWCMAVQQMVLN